MEIAIARGHYSKAIALYEMIAFDAGADRKTRAEAWYKSALLSESIMFDYAKAHRTYNMLVEQYPEFGSLDDARDRIERLSEEIQRYAAASQVLGKVRYKAELPEEEAWQDVGRLRQIIKEHPEYYKSADVYALLGNRYLHLSKHWRALFYCRKAAALNPNLEENSPLGKDLAAAKSVLSSRSLLYSALVLLLAAIVFCLLLKPWRYFKPHYLKWCLLSFLAWLVLACIVFSYPQIRGIPEPKTGFPVKPIYIFLWFRPLLSARFWWFLLYSGLAWLITCLTVLGFSGRKRQLNHYVLICVNSLIATLALLALFYLFHCYEGHYDQMFLFFKEEIELYVDKYPVLFPLGS